MGAAFVILRREVFAEVGLQGSEGCKASSRVFMADNPLQYLRLFNSQFAFPCSILLSRSTFKSSCTADVCIPRLGMNVPVVRPGRLTEHVEKLTLGGTDHCTLLHEPFPSVLIFFEEIWIYYIEQGRLPRPRRMARHIRCLY